MSALVFGTEPIAVIGCGKEKGPRATIAEELYTGPIFTARLALAKRHATTIYIASAHHGLIPSTQWIEPYDRELHSANAASRRAWANDIARDLRLVLHASSGPILALVSGPYAAWVPTLRGEGVEVHTVGDGLPVGRLRSALAAALREAA